MHQLMAALFAAGLDLQQALATGVICGGVALMITAVVQLIQKAKPPTEGQPTPKKINPLVAVLLIASGLALVVVGVVWRVGLHEIKAQEMGRYTSTIAAVATVAFLTILMTAARQGKPTVLAGTGFLLFRHNLFLRGFALFAAFGMPIGITALVIAKPPTKQEDYVAILGLYALFGTLSVPLVWESMRFALVVGPEGLDCHSPWRGRQFFRWEEIEEVSYNTLLSWFVIRATGGRTFRVSVLVTGLNAFLEACEQRLRPEQLRRARGGYAQLGRPFPEKKGGYARLGRPFPEEK